VAWLRAEVEIGAVDPAPVEQALQDAGALAIELRDAGDEAILEPRPGETPLWSRLRIAALFPETVADMDVRRALAQAGAPPQVAFSRIDDADWVGAFRAGLAPRRFGRRLWVCPADEPAAQVGAAVVALEPGMAFGSGDHPTTAMCLEWLDRTMSAGASLLDYGCGSGILALAGLALGAGSAVAVDDDPQARAASRGNAEANGLASRIDVRAPGELSAECAFDRVVANILSSTLIALAPRLTGHCRPGGRLALSGILEHQAAAVRQAFGADFDFEPDRVQDQWVMIAGRRRDVG